MEQYFARMNRDYFSIILNIWKNIGYSQEEIKEKIQLYLNDIKVIKL